ncbi:MAG: Undecaprenyl-phosphate galactosephosphotransferase, partial [uncultured Solirubrobacteraceae bacterium]
AAARHLRPHRPAQPRLPGREADPRRRALRDRARPAGAPDARHRAVPEARGPHGPRLLPPAPDGPGRPAVQRPEVPDDGQERGGAQGAAPAPQRGALSRLPPDERPAGHAHGPAAAPDEPRRAAAVPQRAPGRHEPRRPPAHELRRLDLRDVAQRTPGVPPGDHGSVAGVGAHDDELRAALPPRDRLLPRPVDPAGDRAAPGHGEDGPAPDGRGV